MTARGKKEEREEEEAEKSSKRESTAGAGREEGICYSPGNTLSLPSM